jgi:regulator of protease activity HflC (stomatin/prohibitin superfamily)
MNHIIASKNNLESAKNDAEAARAKTVIAAQAKAEAMAAEGKGIADQRIAIARGIKESIDTIKGAEMNEGEANRLFEFTQWIDMMNQYAAKGPSTVVLPSDFGQTSSMFDQVVAAQNAPRPAGTPQAPVDPYRKSGSEGWGDAGKGGHAGSATSHR